MSQESIVSITQPHLVRRWRTSQVENSSSRPMIVIRAEDADADSEPCALLGAGWKIRPMLLGTPPRLNPKVQLAGVLSLQIAK